MDEVTRMLLSCLKKEAEAEKLKQLKAYSAAEWENVLAAALQYGVAPILFHTLKPLYPELRIPEAVWDKLRRVYFASAARNMRLYHELINLLNIFNQKGIAVILLKGAHLAEFVYGNIALRPMVDVDILAREDDLAKVHQVLIEEGYSSPDGKMSCQLHLPPYSKANSIFIEVHFSLTRPPISEHFNISALWERAQKSSLQGIEVLTLCPEDLILNITTHTCFDHSFLNGLVPYLDLWHVIDNFRNSINWAELWKRANEWGIERSVYLMFALTEKLLCLPIPENIAAKMKPDQEALNALSAAESMIFTSAPEVPPIVARMFEKKGWRKKYKYFIRRTFPAKERMSVTFQESGRKNVFKLYWLYCLRLQTLIKKHGNIIWSGLFNKTDTNKALEMEIQRNNLRDWLTKVE